MEVNDLNEKGLFTRKSTKGYGKTTYRKTTEDLLYELIELMKTVMKGIEKNDYATKSDVVKIQRRLVKLNNPNYKYKYKK
jgi:hypothetical protein